MGKSHSVDLRQRVVSMVASGQSRRAAARHFAISDSSAIKLLQRRERTGLITPARQGRPPGAGKLSAFRDFLVAQVEGKPDITMPELARRVDDEHGLVIPPSSLSRFLITQGYTYKTYGPPGPQEFLFAWQLTSLHQRIRHTAEPLPRWRAARPKPHKNDGIEVPFLKPGCWSGRRRCRWRVNRPIDRAPRLLCLPRSFRPNLRSSLPVNGVKRHSAFAAQLGPT